jgi:hypothetical protein
LLERIFFVAVETTPAGISSALKAVDIAISNGHSSAVPKGENQVISLVGRRFGILTVASLSHTKSGDAHWLCQCDCGKSHVVSAPNLKSGATQSCGCAKDAAIGRKNTRHGDWARRAPEWKTWSGMRDRCRNPKNKDWDRYGGRGITIDPRWDAYEVFLSDVGRKPTPLHQLDRIDNDGPYAPGNCCWATAKEQANNRRLMSINRLGQPIIR